MCRKVLYSKYLVSIFLKEQKVNLKAFVSFSKHSFINNLLVKTIILLDVRSK